MKSGSSNTPKHTRLNNTATRNFSEATLVLAAVIPFFISFSRLNWAREQLWLRNTHTGSVLGNALVWKLKCHWSGRGGWKRHNFIFPEWKDNHLIYEPHSKGLLMKDLLVCARPSYQHLHTKPSPVLLHHTAFWFSSKSQRETLLRSYFLAPSCLSEWAIRLEQIRKGPLDLFGFLTGSFCAFFFPVLSNSPPLCIEGNVYLKKKSYTESWIHLLPPLTFLMLSPSHILTLLSPFSLPYLLRV